MTFDFPSQLAISPRSHPYEQSLSSSASSSSSSVFSVDASSQASSTSSISSSSTADNGWEADDSAWRAQHCPESFRNASAVPAALKRAVPVSVGPTLAQQHRQHPRRCSISRPPPTLMRQSDRKEQFVDGLVDSATQMVEVIWPLSAPAYSADGCSITKGVLPLRTFIQETLRRSRTSFSTLQVAMYYLILIQAHVPKHDFTMEQPIDTPTLRALQCGRRMFLAALILASKYLQDRNYSARAWSKISGLKVCEINTNEMAFLKAVNWKLHVKESLFERWQLIVMSHTPPQASATTRSWKSVIPLLTPELDTLEVSPRAHALREHKKRPVEYAEPLSPVSYGSPGETTPTPSTCKPPRFLEPKPDMLPPTPCLARMGPLPTPQLTPQATAVSTPAAGFAAWNSRRPSMCAAMAQAQNACMGRTMDPWASLSKFNGLEAYSMSSRRPSLANSVSSLSSPESMISDTSSMRSSRASSVSSVSSKASHQHASTMPTKLAKLAALRCAGFPDVQQVREREVQSASSDPMSSPDLEGFHINDDKPVTCTRLESPGPHWKVVLDENAQQDINSQYAREMLAEENQLENDCILLSQSLAKSSKCRKRGRSSVDMTVLQQNIRDQLRDNSTFEPSGILPDPQMPKSFLFQSPASISQCLSTPSTGFTTPIKSTKKARRISGRDSRSCSSEARRSIIRLEGGPGMWDGIL